MQIMYAHSLVDLGDACLGVDIGVIIHPHNDTYAHTWLSVRLNKEEKVWS